MNCLHFLSGPSERSGFEGYLGECNAITKDVVAKATFSAPRYLNDPKAACILIGFIKVSSLAFGAQSQDHDQ
jgi:hypothetical protein